MIRDKNIELAMNDQYSGVGHLLSKENQIHHLNHLLKEFKIQAISYILY